MPRVKLPGTGISKFLYELEGLFLNSKNLETRFYLPWLNLGEFRKQAFMREVARIAWRYMLGKSFRYAVVRTLIKKKGEGIEVDTESPLFVYMKKRMYKGDVRKMIIEMESFAQEVEKDRAQRAIKRFRRVEKD